MPVSSKEFLDIQATIECRFTLKRVHDMTRTYSHEYYVSSLQRIFDDLSKFRKIEKTLIIISIKMQNHAKISQNTTKERRNYKI